jgi:3-polyprenyl-4-hydroxybenzoate decarboxylase
LRRVIFLVMAPDTPRSEIWRALNGAAHLRADCGKYVIAVNEDIDPGNVDAVFWSFAYRANPIDDVVILPNRDGGHGPEDGSRGAESTMLVDATAKGDMPPLALPKREFMEDAKDLWERLGLPPLSPETPWHGYSLGDWSDQWDALAARAVAGDYLENGRRTEQMKRRGIKPNTSVRDLE